MKIILEWKGMSLYHLGVKVGGVEYHGAKYGPYLEYPACIPHLKEITIGGFDEAKEQAAELFCNWALTVVAGQNRGHIPKDGWITLIVNP